MSTERTVEEIARESKTPGPIISDEEAEAICNSPAVLSIFAACEWEELSEDGQEWVKAIIAAALRVECEARPDFPANWNDLSPAVQRAMAQFWQKLSVREREARVKAEAERDEWKAAFEAENLKAHRAGVAQQGALNRLNAAEAEAARLRGALTKIADNGNATGRNPQLMVDLARAALAKVEGR